MGIQDYIAHLGPVDQKYILANEKLVQDILEQQLDSEEIDALLSTAKYVDAQKERKQITMKLSAWTLKKLKIKARQEGIPYQTLINSVLHKYVEN